EETSSHALAAQARGHLRMVDDDQRRIHAAVGHLRHPLAVLLNEKDAAVISLFVLDYVGHLSPIGNRAGHNALTSRICRLTSPVTSASANARRRGRALQ